MNSYFLGTPVILAERYASVLKTMFVCLFFSSIFPQGYFVAAMALFMNYWVRREGEGRSAASFVVSGFCMGGVHAGWGRGAREEERSETFFVVLCCVLFPPRLSNLLLCAFVFVSCVFPCFPIS